jgi:hypothetical protein
LYAPRPVIRPDISGAAANNGADEAELSLACLTAETAKYLGAEMSSDLPSSAILRSLINQPAAESNRPAAVLIDEYDCPLTAFLKKPAETEKMRETMRSYCTQLKNAEEDICLYHRHKQIFAGWSIFGPEQYQRYFGPAGIRSCGRLHPRRAEGSFQRPSGSMRPKSLA